MSTAYMARIVKLRRGVSLEAFVRRNVDENMRMSEKEMTATVMSCKPRAREHQDSGPIWCQHHFYKGKGQSEPSTKAPVA